MEEDRNACVLLLDLPVSAFCGIDLLSFTSSSRFRGVKQLPPGWHFVFVSASNSFSLRYGAWFKVEDSREGPPAVFVKRWAKLNEELLPVLDVAEIQRWRANLGAVWREGLTPYRQTVTKDAKSEGDAVEETQDWNSLTDCITQTLLSRITGMSTEDHWALTSASSAEVDQDHIPGLSQAESILHPEKALGFLPIDLRQTWAAGTVGRARTEAARDRSWALEQIIASHLQTPLDIIGELQFCFLMILTLNNNSCLEQWKRLLTLLLTCTQAVSQQPDLFIRFLSCLRMQLEHCQDADASLFDLSDEGGNLIQVLLRRFRSGLERKSEAVQQDIWEELEELEELLRVQRGWMPNEHQARRGMLELEDGEQVEMDTNRFDEEDETGEYAPMIVDLSPEQMKALASGDDRFQADTLPIPSLSEDSKSGDYSDEDDRDLEELDARY